MNNIHSLYLLTKFTSIIFSIWNSTCLLHHQSVATVQNSHACKFFSIYFVTFKTVKYMGIRSQQMWRYSTRFFPNKYDSLMFLCLFNKPHVYFFIISSNLPLLLWLCASYLTLLSPVVNCGLRSTTSCLIYSFFFHFTYSFSPLCCQFYIYWYWTFLGIKELFLSHIDFMFICFNF